MDQAAKQISESLRAQLVAGAVQVLGSQNRQVAEALAGILGPRVDAAIVALTSLSAEDIFAPDPAVRLERVRAYVERTLEALAQAVVVGAFSALGAGLRVGIDNGKQSFPADGRQH